MRYGRRWTAPAPTFAEVMARRLSRRDVLKGAAASAVVVYLPALHGGRPNPAPPPFQGLTFDPIPPHHADALAVAAGHRADVLLAWGDPVLPGAPPFDPAALTAEAQATQFGYNCDYVGFMPLPRGSRTAGHGLLVVNHEYTNPELMFRDYDPARRTRRQVDVELAAHGMSIVEVFRDRGGRWRVRRESPYNRRITATTPTLVTGPAAGDSLLRTGADPTGRRVVGTLANCSAGQTPWGTILTAEENFHQYFGQRQALPENDPRFWMHLRYGIEREGSAFGFEQVYDRFHLGREPNEAFRFGWVMEVDPYDATWTPRKRTALGRLRREGATSTVAPGGQVVLYSGDDIIFEYVYKFVTAGTYDPAHRDANRDLLDGGTLYAARFNADGSGDWLPLVYGRGPLVPESGFHSQAHVVIQTVRAADLVGATKMDRPEDIEVHPLTGKVYLALTRNPERGATGTPAPDPANPRAANAYGHIIELDEAGGDHAATRFAWRIFILCGDPGDPSTYYAGFPKDRVSAIACPDNLTFDPNGNLWVATDGQPAALDMNDALYAIPTEGPERGRARRFLAGVPGAEITGPQFNPAGDALFVSVQHPGEGGTLAAPLSRWPDGAQPPRPAVVAIQAEDGSPVGMSPPGATPTSA